MRGDIRLGDSWRRFRAREWLAPAHGFLWRARVGRGPFAIRGFDRYVDGRAETRFRMAGLVPVMSAEGPEIDESARGRMAAETILVPAALLPENGTRWTELESPWFRAEWSLRDPVESGGTNRPMSIDLRLDEGGRPVGFRVERLGNPDQRGWRPLAFVGTIAAETTFDGTTIPSRIAVGWVSSEPPVALERIDPVDDPIHDETFRTVIESMEPS